MIILAFLISLSFFTTERVDTIYEAFMMHHTYFDPPGSTWTPAKIDTTKQIWAVTKMVKFGESFLRLEEWMRKKSSWDIIADTFLIYDGEWEFKMVDVIFCNKGFVLPFWYLVLQSREGHNDFRGLLEATGDTIRDLQGKVILPVIRKEK